MPPIPESTDGATLELATNDLPTTDAVPASDAKRILCCPIDPAAPADCGTSTRSQPMPRAHGYSTRDTRIGPNPLCREAPDSTFDGTLIGNMS